MIAKRYTIKPQDDLFGVVDNYSADKICVINGIRTEIEAKWLCKDMNTLNDENEELKQFQDTVFILINEMIETANHYRTPIKSLDYGDDLGYWNGVYQKLKELREILEKRKR